MFDPSRTCWSPARGNRGVECDDRGEPHVVDDAVAAGEMSDLRASLPDDGDWEELFVLADQEEKSVDEDQRPE